MSIHAWPDLAKDHPPPWGLITAEHQGTRILVTLARRRRSRSWSLSYDEAEELAESVLRELASGGKR